MIDRYRIIDGRILNRRCEINVAEHCNLSCRGCSHLSPVVPKSFADPDTVFRDLKALSTSYHARVVMLLGGEPLLHPELLSVIDAVRRSGVCDSIALTTNGLLLPRMTGEFWSAIDEVQVSLYPKRTISEEAQTSCRDEATRHGVALGFHAFNEFQESYSEVGTDDDDLVQRIFTTCNIAHRWRCHNVINGWFYRCPQSHYIPKVLDQGGGSEQADGILIEDSPAFRARLLAYLQSAEVPRACKNCLGSSGRFEEHAQIKRAEFRGRQSAATEDLVQPLLTGSMRVTLAKAESLIPRRIAEPVEVTLMSPKFIKLVRRAQATTRAGLHISEEKTETALKA